MTEAVMTALISAAGGAFSGIFGTVGYSKFKNGRHASNGNVGTSFSALRSDVEFQTRMTVLMDQLTKAIEKGHDRAMNQMGVVAEAISDAAGAIRQVHEEIVAHRAETRPAIQAMYDTQRNVRDLANAKRTGEPR